MYDQKYHQFNTLYNHKFGFHINGPRQDAIEAVLRLKPRIVKTLDFSVEAMRRIREAIPDVFLIGRLVISPQDFGQGQGAQIARQKGIEMAERILGQEANKDIHHVNGRPIFSAWESLNELFPESVDDNSQKLYDEYQVAFGEKIRAAGFEPIGMNFATGNFTGKQFVENFPGTLETYKYLGFHEYDWPAMDRLHKIGLNGPSEPHNLVPIVGEGRGNDGMWLCLRYRRTLFRGVRQKYGDKHVVIITECGMTQGVQGGEDIGPWATVNTLPRHLPDSSVPVPISPDDYWQSLMWYNGELMKDDYVMGACLFVTGAAGKKEWETFEHLGEIMNRLEAFQKTVSTDFVPSVPPQTETGPVEVTTTTFPSPAQPTPTQPAPGGQIVDISANLPTNPQAPPYQRRPRGAIRRFIIHHTATSPQVTVQRIAEFQTQRQNKPGIAYHFCITAAGEIFQTQPLEVVSLHAGQYSADSLGVCLIGNFTTTPPLAPQLNAAAALLAQVANDLGLSLDANTVLGHRELVNTQSPGATWPAWKTNLINRARAIQTSLTATPTLSSTPTTHPKVIEHYLLLWHQNPGNWAEWDLISAIDYVGQFHPTIGFSIEEAKHAKYVTIVGGPAGVPDRVEQILRAAGCQVERLGGRTQEETNQMLYDLLAQGRRFRTLR
jgi:N-acetylmuramoyl-L-alanine amidase